MTGHRNRYALDGPIRLLAWAAGSLGLGVLIWSREVLTISDRAMEWYENAHVDLGGED